MDITYKEDSRDQSSKFLNFEDPNLSTIYLPSGKLDPTYFGYFYQLFLSKLSSQIEAGFKALIKYAKEGNIDLFIQNGISKLNKCMVDTAFDNYYNFLEKTLRLYKWMTKCNPQQLDCILDDKIIEFFYSIYRKPSNLICKSLIFRIFSNILSKSEIQFNSFINQGYHIRLIDIFWKHFAMIDESDEDSRVVSSILKFLPVFYLNNDSILARDRHFFDQWNVAFTKCLKIENRFITPALSESIRNCTNIENYVILSSFFLSVYFPTYFELCVHDDRKVRLNMISTFLNFKFLDAEDLERIVQAGLFNIELNYDEIEPEEIFQFLNVMHEYLLKSLNIAEEVAFSRIIWELNNNGSFLDYENKKLLFVIFAQLIRAKQVPILNQVFELCPSYIELSSEFLDSQIENHQVILLESYFDLFSYSQNDPESELAVMIISKLFDDEMFNVLNSLVDNCDSSIITFEKTRALMDLLKENCPQPDDC